MSSGNNNIGDIGLCFTISVGNRTNMHIMNGCTAHTIGEHLRWGGGGKWESMLSIIIESVDVRTI